MHLRFFDPMRSVQFVLTVQLASNVQPSNNRLINLAKLFQKEIRELFKDDTIIVEAVLPELIIDASKSNRRR